jgi:hypothetical protein
VFQEIEAADFKTIKFISPSHQMPLACRKYFWFSFLLEAELTQGDSLAGRILPIKIPVDLASRNSSDSIGNQTHDLLACSTVPQPTVPLHALV